MSLFGDREVWDNTVNQMIVLHGGYRARNSQARAVSTEAIPGGQDVRRGRIVDVEEMMRVYREVQRLRGGRGM